MPRIKDTHIERLARGKASGIHIGSRGVPHHLRTHERATFERAQRQGFLVMDHRDRLNVATIWEKWCKATQKPVIICTKSADGRAVVWRGAQIGFEGSIAEAKMYAASLVQ